MDSELWKLIKLQCMDLWKYKFIVMCWLHSCARIELKTVGPTSVVHGDMSDSGLRTVVPAPICQSVLPIWVTQTVVLQTDLTVVLLKRFWIVIHFVKQNV